jgi:four helix bundle protein
MLKEFSDLDAWKEARSLVNSIYKITKSDNLVKDYGLKDQIQRASVSVMSNIAEGVAASSNVEFIRFLKIARRSSNEVQSLLFVLLDQKYINKDNFDIMTEQARKVSQIINGLIRYLKKKYSNEITSKRENE